MAVKLNKHDLEFVLKQIKIAEAHASGIPLDQIRVDANGNYGTEGQLAISQPHLPYGLRTVDGSYNNIIPERELWGAADQTMPRMFDPNWRNETDGDVFDPDGPTQPAPPLVDGNYNSGGETPGTGGSIVDADPRIISNLIADQSPNNPAALIAALRHAGHEGDLSAKMASVTEPFALLHAAKVAQARVDSWQKTADDLLAAASTTPPPPNAAMLLGMRAGIIAPGGALPTAQAAAATAQDEADAYSISNVDHDGDPNTPTVTITGADEVLAHVAAELGIEFEVDGTSLKIPNVAPDEGLSAPFNGWMTFFGQFFDHGLDLISKGGDGTIYVPLQPDDPLYVEGGFTNFMVLTRATQVAGPGTDGVLGTADDTQREAVNVTTPFVDQNQTYTSHPSHQVFLREYQMDANGNPVSTGRLLGNRSPATGENGEPLQDANGNLIYFGGNSRSLEGLTTWAVVKAQARELLGIELTDRDVFNIPLVRTDLYGKFIPDPETGFAQVIIHIGADGIPNTADDLTMSGTPASPVKLNPADGGTEPVRTSHSFLDDIAHNAVPVLDTNGVLVTDGVPVGQVDPAGNAVQFNPLTGRNTEYDNELLDKHFVTGDGRGNENIGLTAVHHVFHSEHNRQVAVNQLEILKTGDLAFINEWLLTDLTDLGAIPAGGVALAEYAKTLNWDGERLFQTARFATEMQYQHLVFEEFGRKIQPMIDVFVFNTITDIDPAIFAEFAHVVYRFGHSMLTEEITRMFLDEDGNPVRYGPNGSQIEVLPDELDTWGQNTGLIEAFLNPIEFDKDGAITHDQAAGAIFRGMSLVHGNEIDEFVVDALRTNLLGLPLDLAAVNIARGRDTGMPTLNQAREQLYAASNSTFVKPYESWSDFAGNLKNSASVINFIAAYGRHPAILALEDGTLEQKRAAATLLVLGDGGAPGDVTINGILYTDRLNFLNSTGNWTAQTSGLNDIDLWIGGLAEKKMPFGGMLGSTFNAVFEAQLEMLQDLDRFYYLTRTQGLNLLNELENNAFSKMIAANSDMIDPGPDGIRGTEDDVDSGFRTGVDSFAKHDFVLSIDPDKQVEADPEHDDEALNAIGMTKVQRDNLLTDVDEAPLKNYIRFIGGEHVVIGGSEGSDTIIADFGDDAIWGGGGDDRIEAGAGVDLVIGGAGNDIITDSGDTGDFLKGEDGDDIIANSNGLDILMGGDGKDVFFVGVDGTEVFAGEGDDFILGGADIDFLMGNEGDDWMEGGDGFDTTAGDNSELFFNSTIIGHDVMFAGENEHDFDAESGDDIMVQGESVMRNEGMFGFDWAIHKGNRVAADSDMRIPIFTTVADDILRDRFDQTEALSGWIHNDVLRGDDRGSQEEIETELDMTNHELSWAGVDRIDGLEELLGGLLAPRPDQDGADLEKAVAFKAGNILIGGDGNDTIEGRGGDDFIHGDAWLNVRIRITAPVLDASGKVTGALPNDAEGANEIATVDTLKHVFTLEEVDAFVAALGQTPDAALVAHMNSWVGKSMFDLMMARVIVPAQMHIQREILYDEHPEDNVDTAIYAGNKDWYEITEFEDGTVRVARREMEEVDPQVDEGVDTLVGIERIQFADQTVVLQQSGNHEPVGRLEIIGLPAKEGVVLRVSADDVYDANNPGVVGEGNIPTLEYRWQIERNDGTGDYINIPGAFGNTFIPGDEHTGLRIRVIASYVDAGGVTETVMSLPTDVVIGVNDEPAGALLISDMSPTEGQTLTMTVAFNDPDGITDAFEEGLIAYQWQWANSADGPWTDVQGATGLNWTIPTSGSGDSDFGGRFIRAQVIYTDDLGNQHTVHSAVTGVVGELVNGTTGVNNPLNGSAGDDTINGNSGNDLLNGLLGNDVLNGGNDNDTLNGGAGNDTLDGGAGNDAYNGEDGDDTFIYRNGQGVDTFNGGDGIDALSFFGDDDDDGLDVVFNGSAITLLEGGALSGVEIVTADMVDSDDEDGGDTLNYQTATTTGVVVNLLTGAASGFAYIRNIENVEGADFNDDLTGDNEANRLVGDGGDDLLRGGFGNDLLLGGTGNDRLYGDEGDDVLVAGASTGTPPPLPPAVAPPITAYDRVDGGEGSDTASYADAGAAVSVDLSIFGPQYTGSATGNDWLIDIENLLGSGNADTLRGDANNNVIDGGGGADLMEGRGGDDTYVIDDTNANGGLDQVLEAVGGGNDTIRSALSINLETGAGFAGQEIENIVLTGTGSVSATGNGLANRLTGNSGNNALNGGAGEDTVVLSGSHESKVFGLSGSNVTITASGQGTDTLTSVERADIGGTSYRIVAGTNNPDASLNSDSALNGGKDLVLGFNGDDTLNGGNDDDILKGGSGNDHLNGGAGNDILDGGTSGGLGAVIGTFADDFNDPTSNNYTGNNGTLNFSGNWIEGNDGAAPGSATAGDIQVIGSGAGRRLQFNDSIDGGESIFRAFNAAGAAAVTVSFDFEDDSLTGGDQVLVQARLSNGTWQTLTSGTLEGVLGDGNSGNGTFTATLTGDQIGSHSAIRFLAEGNWDNGDNLYIDNVVITARGTPLGDTMEGGAGDDTYYVDNSATNADQVIEADGGGNDTVMLTTGVSYTLANEVENLVARSGGNRTLTGNAEDNQITGGSGNDRIDGAGGSDTAIYANGVVSYTIGTNNAGEITISGPGAGADTLVNVEKIRFGDQTVIVNTQTSLGNDDITVNGTEGQIILGRDGNDSIVGGDGNDIIIGGAGNDTLFGSEVGTAGDNATTGADDNDTFIWTATGNDGFGDGVDTINGGFEGAGGDTFIVNGNNSSETFGIYTYDQAVALLGYDGDDEVEILVTRRTGNNDPTIIAELTDIEEIVVNGGGGNNQVAMFGDFSLTSLRPNTITIVGSSGDDTVDISSLLSAHRIVFKTGGGNDVIVGTLRPQDVVELPQGTTIADFEVTIDEATGTVELVGDGHTISFTATGDMPQFASNDGWLPEDDYDGGPPIGDGDEDEDEDEETPPVGDDDHDDDHDHDHDHCDDDDDDDDQGQPVDNGNGSSSAPRMLIGTTAADVLLGAAGNDTILGGGSGDILSGEAGSDILRGEDGDDLASGGDGDDTMSGGAGSDELHGGMGADMLFGNDGADMVHGDAGDDLIEAGAGDDKAWGGAGNDRILATAADGSDQYWGDEGNDTLDYSVATGNLNVDLGNGFMGRGQVTGHGGTDMFYGFENFIGGSGHDVINATSAVNIMDGGLGNDTFRFQSASAAHGDTIYGFAPGDKIDFSAMDANTTIGGSQGFTLSAGSTLTAAGQVAVSYDVRDGGEVTLVRGNIDGDPDAEFELTLIGRHNLTASDFSGIS
nr:heme peroxidase [Rhizobium sp. Q54]